MLRSISAPGGAGFPSARILLLDIHGEYAPALGDNAEIFRIAPEVKTWLDQTKTQPAIVLAGDAATLRLPTYQPHTTKNTAPYQNNVGVLGIRKQLDRMRSRMLDRQFEFLLNPGDWEPNLTGHVANDLPALLESWIGTRRR